MARPANLAATVSEKSAMRRTSMVMLLAAASVMGCTPTATRYSAQTKAESFFFDGSDLIIQDRADLRSLLIKPGIGFADASERTMTGAAEAFLRERHPKCTISRVMLFTPTPAPHYEVIYTC